MTPRVQSLSSGICCLVAVAFAVPLGAQARRVAADSSRFDVAIGLTMSATDYVNRKPTCTSVGVPCETSGREFPEMGFFLEGVLHATPTIAVVGEASIYFNYWDTTDVIGADSHRIDYVRALLAGPRFTSPALYPFRGQPDPIFAYVQLLAGPEAATVAPTRFALQPGISVYSPVALRSPFSRGADARLHLAWDYRWTRGEPRNHSGGRFVFALAFGD
jgi:hypothetical protein